MLFNPNELKNDNSRGNGMIRIIDTFSEIGSLFDEGEFNQEKWEKYINNIYDNSANIFKNDLKECLDGGKYIFEKDVLPIINAVYAHSELEALHTSFCKATDELNKKIHDRFGRELNVDIVLYVGLCNAAGWVTNINGQDVILLGIEKILELNWCDIDSMYGLIYHELGHVYHMQYGKSDQKNGGSNIDFVWQLFTEGIAMYFEQSLVNDFNYYHQDKNGWLSWCESNFRQIVRDFYNDLPTMTKYDQKYFGDWVSYNGKGDVGYYLGAKFVKQLREKYDFEYIINMNICSVYQEYVIFTRSLL